MPKVCQKKSKVKSAPSFVVKFPLTVTQAQEVILTQRLNTARQIYNACLGEALRRREYLIHHGLFDTARTMKPGQARTTLFRKIEQVVGFTEYALHTYAKRFGKTWLGDLIDSLTV